MFVYSEQVLNLLATWSPKFQTKQLSLVTMIAYLNWDFIVFEGTVLAFCGINHQMPNSPVLCLCIGFGPMLASVSVVNIVLYNVGFG